MTTATPFEGLRVLVVEDELLVAITLQEILRTFGCTIVGPVSRLPAALEAARTEQFDVALLDVSLAGERVFPVADVLIARFLPFAFLTGHGGDVIPPQYGPRPALSKPFRIQQLRALIDQTTRV
jgi:CheY-like chemotaxis protein